jgi:hypothetical protein
MKNNHDHDHELSPSARQLEPADPAEVDGGYTLRLLDGRIVVYLPDGGAVDPLTGLPLS